MEEEFWKKCCKIILLPRLHLKNPLLSREILHVLKDIFESDQENAPDVRIIVDKILSRVIVQEIIIHWSQCCLFQLKQIAEANKLSLCCKRLSYLAPLTSPPFFCNLCRHENGNHIHSDIPQIFDLNQAQELLRISSTNILLDATLQFVVPIDSYLEGIGEYVKHQLLNLLHHEGNMSLTPIEKDCLDNSSFHLYGSSVTGLQISSVESDIDLMIKLPSNVKAQQSDVIHSDDPEADGSSDDEENGHESDDDEDDEDEENDDDDDENEDDDDDDDDNEPDEAQEETKFEDFIDDRTIRINQIVNRELREVLNFFLAKEKKHRTHPRITEAALVKSNQYLEFLEVGMTIITENENNLNSRIQSHKLATTKLEDNQNIQLGSNPATKLHSTSENILPEVDILHLLEKYIRKYGSKYGIFLKTYLRHTRVPLLLIQIKLPKNLNISGSSDHLVSTRLPFINCDLTVYKFHPLRNTAFICSFLNWDQSQKVKSLILLVKRFVQVNEIHGAANGYLSSYSWVMLVLHFLLRLKLLPSVSFDDSGASAKVNEQDGSSREESSTASFGFTLDSDFTSSRIIECSVSELFKFFLYYYTTQINIISDVITLRNDGEILSKKIWKKKKSHVWRFSIEDPFERADTSYPHDLGEPLKLHGQTKMFKILSYGYATMKEIEELCLQGDVATAGTVFYSLFEVKQQQEHQQQSQRDLDSSHKKLSKRSKRNLSNKKAQQTENKSTPTDPNNTMKGNRNRNRDGGNRKPKSNPPVGLGVSSLSNEIPLPSPASSAPTSASVPVSVQTQTQTSGSKKPKRNNQKKKPPQESKTSIPSSSPAPPQVPPPPVDKKSNKQQKHSRKVSSTKSSTST